MIDDAPAHVARLSAWLAETDIALLELTGPDGTLRLVRSGPDVTAAFVAAGPIAAPPADATVEAATVGVFLDRHPLRLAPEAAPGASLRRGDVLGFLRIGPLLQAVAAPCDGVLAAVLAAPGATVGYGTPLFAIAPFAREETP